MKLVIQYGLTGIIALALCWVLLNRASLKKEEQAHQANNTEVGATEDLMREHGVLNRILLIYEEIERRFAANGVVNLNLLYEAATIIHTFIENYHEKLEEEYIFPRLEAVGELQDMVQELRIQHGKGRLITQKIRDLTHHPLLESAQKDELRNLLRQSVYMYRAHESREDTQVFPAFHRITPEKEYAKLGDLFEKKEQETLGEHGFEKTLAHVITLEKELGINSLEHYMPTIVR